MIAQTSGIEKSIKCSAAIGTAYTIAKFGADDNAASLAAAATDSLIGIFQHTTDNAGESARIMMSGISRIVLGGTVTRGDRLTSDSNGKGVSAGRHTHTENTAASYAQNATTQAASAVNTIGLALASGVSGDIIPVLVLPSSI